MEKVFTGEKVNKQEKLYVGAVIYQDVGLSLLFHIPLSSHKV